jgi:serine/threonine protein kinase
MDSIQISKPLRKPSSWGMLFKGKIGADSVILKVMHADPRDKFDYHEASFDEGCVKGKIESEQGCTEIASTLGIGPTYYDGGIWKPAYMDRIPKKYRKDLQKIVDQDTTACAGYIIVRDISDSYSFTYLRGRLPKAQCSDVCKEKLCMELTFHLMVLHMNSILHCDAQFENIRMSKNAKETFIIDFGEARRLQRTVSMMDEIKVLEGNQPNYKFGSVNSLPHYFMAKYKDKRWLRKFNKKYTDDKFLKKRFSPVEGLADVNAKTFKVWLEYEIQSMEEDLSELRGGLKIRGLKF